MTTNSYLEDLTTRWTALGLLPHPGTSEPEPDPLRNFFDTSASIPPPDPDHYALPRAARLSQLFQNFAFDLIEDIARISHDRDEARQLHAESNELNAILHDRNQLLTTALQAIRGLILRALDPGVPALPGDQEDELERLGLALCDHVLQIPGPGTDPGTPEQSAAEAFENRMDVLAEESFERQAANIDPAEASPSEQDIADVEAFIGARLIRDNPQA